VLTRRYEMNFRFAISSPWTPFDARFVTSVCARFR